MTYEQIEAACANIGHNLDCGSCAALFYTGYGGYEHDEGCPKARTDSFGPASSAEEREELFVCAEEPRFVWRRSAGDFVTDILGELGPMVAVGIEEEIAQRTGVAVIARDREAAVGWVYGRPSIEMGAEWAYYVKTGVRTSLVPALLHRLARSFAEVRTEAERP